MKEQDFKGNRNLNVNAFYCKDCKHYFINYEALQELYDKNNYPLFHMVFMDSPLEGWKKVSKLALYGYSVKQGGLTDFDRQRLLKWIIDNNIMEKHQIIRNIESKINYNWQQYRMENAVKKWKADIQFVSNYTVGNKRMILHNFI